MNGRPPYYLTAYGLAVKHGFQGTEEAWLETLRGPDGLSAYQVAVKHGYTGTEAEWNAGVNASRAAAEQARTAAEAAKKAAESAQREAEAAAGAAGGSASAAAGAAGAAQDSREGAETALAGAGGYATTAGTKAAEAAESAGSAKREASLAAQARQAIESMMVEAVTVATGKPATVTKALVDGVVKLVFGLPKGEKGNQGDRGVSVQSIQRTAGNGSPGTRDTYTITMDDGTSTTFQVYNGLDGGVASFNGRTGAVVPQDGDYTPEMVGAVPDPGTAVKDAPAATDHLLVFDSADGGKPKKTLVSKFTDFLKGTFYTKAETDGAMAKKASALNANVTLNVSPSGSDAAGNWSGVPYRTVQAALDSLPKCLNGFTANIRLAAGDYGAGVEINITNFYGGILQITGPSSGKASFASAWLLCNNSGGFLRMHTNIEILAPIPNKDCIINVGGVGSISSSISIDGGGTAKGYLLYDVPGMSIGGDISNCTKAMSAKVLGELLVMSKSVCSMGAGNAVAFEAAGFHIIQDWDVTIEGTKTAAYGGRIWAWRTVRG